jgi:LacI family transcriptional regulator
MITTDLFPALAERIRKNEVLATIDQRPYTQGRLSFRVLHQFLVEGSCPTCQVTLSPHLVMRGNLEYFLEHQSQDVTTERGTTEMIDSGDRANFAAG